MEQLKIQVLHETQKKNSILHIIAQGLQNKNTDYIGNRKPKELKGVSYCVSDEMSYNSLKLRPFSNIC